MEEDIKLPSRFQIGDKVKYKLNDLTIDDLEVFAIRFNKNKIYYIFENALDPNNENYIESDYIFPNKD